MSKEAYVRHLFSRIAADYDFLNGVISLGQHQRWRRASLKLAGLPPRGFSAVDLCAGTGDYTIQLARMGAGSTTAVDFNQTMLSIAQQRCVNAWLNGSVKFVVGDVTNLTSLQGNQFDIATVGFGLRNVSDLPAALSEALRVLKPGGKLLCLDLTEPKSTLVKSLFTLYMRAVMPAAVWLCRKRFREYLWLSDSLADFPSRKRLSRMFEDAGFANVRSWTVGMGAVAIHVGEKPPFEEPHGDSRARERKQESQEHVREERR